MRVSAAHRLPIVDRDDFDWRLARGGGCYAADPHFAAADHQATVADEQVFKLLSLDGAFDLAVENRGVRALELGRRADCLSAVYP